MNGKELLTQGHGKPKLGFVSSSTYKSDIGMHCQVSPSGGRMGGVSGLPPSNTMTSSSISWIDNLWWLHRIATSQVHVVVYWTSTLHHNYGNDEWCWIFVVENVQLRHIECKETKMMRTSKHKPNWGHRWISNHVCDCRQGNVFVEYKRGS